MWEQVFWNHVFFENEFWIRCADRSAWLGWSLVFLNLKVFQSEKCRFGFHFGDGLAGWGFFEDLYIVTFDILFLRFEDLICFFFIIFKIKDVLINLQIMTF